MSRNWLFPVLCISTALVFAQLVSAGINLSVNESATRFLVQDQTLVELEINNPTKQTLPVRISVDLLTPKEVVSARAMRDVPLSAGVNKITLPFSFLAAAAKTYGNVRGEMTAQDCTKKRIELRNFVPLELSNIAAI